MPTKRHRRKRKRLPKTMVITVYDGFLLKHPRKLAWIESVMEEK